MSRGRPRAPGRRPHGGAEQFLLQIGEVDFDNFGHSVGIREFDEVEKAAAQKGVRQFFFVIGCDKHQRTVLGFDELARFVAVKLHAVEFAQQIVRKLDIGLVDFINQKRHGRVRFKGLPQHTFDDVVFDVFHLLVAQLRIAQAADSIVFIQTLLRF